MSRGNRHSNRHEAGSFSAFFGLVLPESPFLGPLKDKAQEVITASAELEGRVAPDTAKAIGDLVRLINSYYSNLIEGHKTTLPEIRAALDERLDGDEEQRYAQELCAAHVRAEKELMADLEAKPEVNVCSPEFLARIHSVFYGHLPEEHRFAHGRGGFTDVPVHPGVFRDRGVGIGSRGQIGPSQDQLPACLDEFDKAYAPGAHHGDERLIAMAASHHRLTWMHPFRDGNGRVSRLHSGLYMARAGVNRANLWSLSRGLSRSKAEYMTNLMATDSSLPGSPPGWSPSELLADFVDFFLDVCLDQIAFMKRLLRLEDIESRIEFYVATRSRTTGDPMRPEAARLLRAVFMHGAVQRGEAMEIMNLGERVARQVVSMLISQGLLTSTSHKARLTIGFPDDALPYYFPALVDPSVIGGEYVPRLAE